jgi:hypothetical protein
MKNEWIEKFKALALLANLEWTETHELPNGYWPDCEEYADIRKQYPWLLFVCPNGTVTMGWRKRVICVSWTLGNADPIEDENLKSITHDKDFFHAYNMPQALTFLTKVIQDLKETGK